MKKILFILIQFMLALTLFGEKNFYSLRDRVLAEEYFIKGVYHYNNTEFQAAIDAFRNATTTMPFYDKVKYWLGKAYLMAGYRQFAINEWEGMVKVNSADILVGQKLQQLYSESFIDQKVNLESPYALLKYFYSSRSGTTSLEADENGHLFISNFVSSQLEERDSNFSLVKTLDAGLSKPMDLSIEDQYIAVASFGNDQVKIYDKQSGKIVFSIGGFGVQEGKFAGPTGVYLHNKMLYVADSGNNRVQVFRISPSPQFMLTFGDKGKETGNFYRPSDVAYLDQKIYVADLGNKRIQVFDESGNFINQFGEDYLDTPRKLIVRGKRLYVLDEIKGLLLYDEESQAFKVIKSNSQDFQKPLGVHFDKNGILYIADFFTNKISAFIPDKMKLSSLRLDSLLTLNTGFPSIAVKMRVQDLKGNDIKGLTGKNFKLFQEGEMMKDVNVFPLKPEAAKVSLMVLNRTSASMKKYKPELIEYFRKILDHLKFNDRVAIMNFNGNQTLAQTFVNKRLTLMEALNKTQYENTTEDSLDYSLYQALSKNMNNEFYNAVLLIDDGGNKADFKRYNPEVLASYAQKNGIPIFILQMGEGSNSQQLKYIAEESGGMVLNYYKSNKIYSLFELIRENQPLFYILTYKSPFYSKINKTQWMNVLIELNYKGLYGADRTGYYIP